jgi:prepilin peptidase CpaA
MSLSLLALVQTGCLLVFALLLLTAAWQDLRTMEIADGLSLGIVGAFAAWAVAGLAGGMLSLWSVALSLACAIGVFLAGAGAFAMGMLGGGDVKLLGAASLFAGPALMLDFITGVALAGGLLGIAMLVGARIGSALPTGDGPTGDGTLRTRLRGSLPYGPAIAAGGLWLAASLTPI